MSVEISASAKNECVPPWFALGVNSLTQYFTFGIVSYLFNGLESEELLLGIEFVLMSVPILFVLVVTIFLSWVCAVDVTTAFVA